MDKKGTVMIPILFIILLALGTWLLFGKATSSLSVSSLGSCTYVDGTDMVVITCTQSLSTIQRDNEMTLTGVDNPAQKGYTITDFIKMECATVLKSASDSYAGVTYSMITIPGRVVWTADGSVYCRLDTPGGSYFTSSKSNHISTIFKLYKQDVSIPGSTTTTTTGPDSGGTGGVVQPGESTPGTVSAPVLAWWERFINWLRSIFK